MWCVPALDAAYVDRMEDVLDLYEKPYRPVEPVVCLDESPSFCIGTSVRAARRNPDG